MTQIKKKYCVKYCSVAYRLCNSGSACNIFIAEDFPCFFSVLTCVPDYSTSTITNGDISCSDGNNYGSVCTFECDADYKIDGQSNVLECTEPGWDANAPVCQGEITRYCVSKMDEC